MTSHSPNKNKTGFSVVRLFKETFGKNAANKDQTNVEMSSHLCPYKKEIQIQFEVNSVQHHYNECSK